MHQKSIHIMENIIVSARLLFSLLFLSSIAQISLAQVNSASVADQAEVSDSAVINPVKERITEEIIVTEQLPLYRLRQITIEAEDKVYELFNELVDEKRFEITCGTKQRNNSRFNYRECKPEFERQVTSAEARDHLAMTRSMTGNPGELSAGSISLGTAVPQEFSIVRQHKELQQKMQTLARENPRFLQSLIEFVEAKQRMESYERVDDEE